MTNQSSPSSPDLFAQLRALADANIAKKKAKETPGISPKTKTKLNAKAKSAKKNLEDMIAEAAKKARKKVSPWHPTAIILPIIRHHCKSCQAEFTSPGGSPLVRFEHKRNGTIWETAGHPSQQNPNLPKKVRVIDLEVEVCPRCFSPTPILSEPGSPQLPLPLEFPRSKGINIFPTKETLEMVNPSHPIRSHLPSHPSWPEDPNRPKEPLDPWEDIPQIPPQSS